MHGARTQGAGADIRGAFDRGDRAGAGQEGRAVHDVAWQQNLHDLLVPVGHRQVAQRPSAFDEKQRRSVARTDYIILPGIADRRPVGALQRGDVGVRKGRIGR